MASRILVVSHLFEPSVDEVIKHLDKRGACWSRLNCEDYPLLLAGTIELKPGADSVGFVSSRDSTLRSDDVGAVWLRRATRPALPASMSRDDRDFVRGEVSAFINGFLDLCASPAINDREAEIAYSNKTRQLDLAKRVGFSVPQTVITNDPSRVREFAEGREIIFKPLAGVAIRPRDFTASAQDRFIEFGPVSVNDEAGIGSAHTMFTQVLTPDKLDRIESLRLSPAIFQEFVRKTADIRVTVVGEAIMACRILSQEEPSTTVDFRRMALLPKGKSIRHEAFRLPHSLEELIHKFMHASGLVFGCIDFVERGDEYIFLEINPNGQWLWVERAAGLPISSQIAEELIRFTKNMA